MLKVEVKAWIGSEAGAGFWLGIWAGVAAGVGTGYGAGMVNGVGAGVAAGAGARVVAGVGIGFAATAGRAGAGVGFRLGPVCGLGFWQVLGLVLGTESFQSSWGLTVQKGRQSKISERPSKTSHHKCFRDSSNGCAS